MVELNKLSLKHWGVKHKWRHVSKAASTDIINIQSESDIRTIPVIELAI
jgi:hypothetical protein